MNPPRMRRGGATPGGSGSGRPPSAGIDLARLSRRGGRALRLTRPNNRRLFSRRPHREALTRTACPRCGASWTAESSVCEACGYGDVGRVYDERSWQSRPAGSATTPGVAWAAFALGLAGLGLAIWFSLRRWAWANPLLDERTATGLPVLVNVLALVVGTVAIRVVRGSPREFRGGDYADLGRVLGLLGLVVWLAFLFV